MENNIKNMSINELIELNKWAEERHRRISSLIRMGAIPMKQIPKNVSYTNKLFDICNHTQSEILERTLI